MSDDDDNFKKGPNQVVKVTKADRPVGTRIEISFGPALPDDPEAFAWAELAQKVAGVGQTYGGRSSLFWYDAAQFHELILAYRAQPMRSLIARLDGCTGGRAGEIVAAAGLDRALCQDIDREQATRLLKEARRAARPVSADRLGFIGRAAFDGFHYAVEREDAVALGGSQPRAELPVVVEAWARKVGEKGGITLDLLINRMPSTVNASAWRDSDKDLCLMGNGLRHRCTDTPKKVAYESIVNVTTPYCPITSDGKAPDLAPFADAILEAVSAATRKAQRAAPRDKKVSQKDVVLDNLDDAIAAQRGDEDYRFNERQLLYWLRPIVREQTGQELTSGNFKAIITDYENEYGEIDGMYREPRGSIYHPHRDEDIALGTLNG